MFFLPLPLDKTLQTIEDVENSKDVDSVGLTDSELYILVSGKLSKQNVLWQSMVNIAQVRAAVQKLKQTNWLYANIAVSRCVNCCWCVQPYEWYMPARSASG